MREGEILKLKWGVVSLKDGVINLPKEIRKTHKDRANPISDELAGVLDRLPRGIKEDYPVFPFKGKEIHDIRAVMRKACNGTKIVYGRSKGEGFIFHNLRRTFYTDARKADVQESVIKEITGHARNEVVDRYNQVDLGDVRQAIERLTAYRKGQIANVDENVDQKVILG